MSGYFITVFLGTFVLEDAALLGAAALIAQNHLSFALAFLACFAGIALGDLGLYGLGALSRRFTSLRQLPWLRQKTHFVARNGNAFATWIVLARMIPGTRLPTYVGAGFLRFGLVRFTGLTIFSVGPWVFAILWGGADLTKRFSDHIWGVLVVLLLLLHIIHKIVPQLMDRWSRRALLHSWRKWMSFEFWPATIFYLPIVPYYIYRSLVGRSFLLPFYANPGIFNGGIIGESKWDFLKHLKREDPTTLPSILIRGESESVQTQIRAAGLDYPFILKPDVGQRGYGVRIVRSREDLHDYLRASGARDLVAQRLSRLPHEAGIFYYRRPSEQMGTLFSITDKEFPILRGDGHSPVGRLILNDRRARILANVYFTRHRRELDQVLAPGETFALAECGNHCQGAIFKNGQALKSNALLVKIDSLAKAIPHFYFGRFDVKFQSHELLRQGLEFEIVEVNGAGSEATHIWDAKTGFCEAYRTLFAQWKILFALGAEVKRRREVKAQVHLGAFLRESLKVFRRQDDLSVSS